MPKTSVPRSAPVLATEPGRAPPARVMVVEDEALIALDIERRLRRAGFEVVGIADNRDEAMALFLETSPDLVLMDIFIHPAEGAEPGVPGDGVETARAIGAVADVPVVFLTAYADDATLRRAAETSPYGYLLKPFDERTLVTTITVALERHASDTRVRLLGSAFDASAVGIALVETLGPAVDGRDGPGAAGRVTSCNDAFLRLVALPHAEVVGRPPELPVVDSDDPSYVEVVEALRTGVGASATLRGRTPSGEERWTSVTVSPVPDRAGRLTHLVLLCADVSRERRTEDALAERERDYADLARMQEQLRERAAALAESLDTLRSTQRELVRREKLASLGVLVAGIAHEVNTPLGVAVTAGSLVGEALAELERLLREPSVRRSTLSAQIEAARAAQALAERNLSRAAHLVRDFKTVAVDQGSDSVRTFEIGGYVRDVISSLAPLLRRSPVTVALAESGPIEVSTRPGMISQVVTNVVTNALAHAYAPGQVGTLRIDLSRDGENVVLVASDDGRGMPPDVAQHAFDPFFTTAAGNGGSGLGLFVVHNLVVDGLGGDIALDTAPGRGTTFTLRFPCVLLG